MRVVLDTNVLVPGLFAPGLCESLLDVLLETEGCVIVLSEHILDECREHATRKFKVPAVELNAALDLLVSAAEIVEPAKLPRDSCSDSDDVPVLGTAVAGKPDALITGDRQLLALKSFRTIRILTPRDFFDELR